MGLDIYLTLRNDDGCEREYHFRKQKEILDIAIENGMEVLAEEYESGMIGEKELDYDTVEKIWLHYYINKADNWDVYEDMSDVHTLTRGQFTCILTADW